MQKQLTVVQLLNTSHLQVTWFECYSKEMSIISALLILSDTRTYTPLGRDLCFVHEYITSAHNSVWYTFYAWEISVAWLTGTLRLFQKPIVHGMMFELIFLFPLRKVLSHRMFIQRHKTVRKHKRNKYISLAHKRKYIFERSPLGIKAMFWEKELLVTRAQEMPGPEGPAVGPATRGRCGHSHCQTLAKRDLDREEGILPSFASPAPALLLVNSSWGSHFHIWKQKNSTILRRSLAKKKKNPGNVKMSIILMGNKTQLQLIWCSCQDIAKVLTLSVWLKPFLPTRLYVSRWQWNCETSSRTRSWAK